MIEQAFSRGTVYRSLQPFCIPDQVVDISISSADLDGVIQRKLSEIKDVSWPNLVKHLFLTFTYLTSEQVLF